jgi:hypothetical protein
MPRFAILQHDHLFLHWDLLLEDGGSCRTWRLLAEPVAGLTVSADRIADHRLVYLDYEGPVSGDRGTVARFDAGTFAWIADEGANIEVELAGSRLAGRCTIRQLPDGCQVRFDARL